MKQEENMERKLTPEVIAYMLETRKRVLGERRLDFDSLQALRDAREGRVADTLAKESAK